MSVKHGGLWLLLLAAFAAGANDRPQTWFHLIGGNVSKEGIVRDLDAIAAYTGRLVAKGAPLDGRLDGVLVDSWECGFQNWTSEGLDVRTADWPALFGYVVGDRAATRAFYRNWRNQLSARVNAGFYKTTADLIRSVGGKFAKIGLGQVETIAAVKVNGKDAGCSGESRTWRTSKASARMARTSWRLPSHRHGTTDFSTMRRDLNPSARRGPCRIQRTCRRDNCCPVAY